MSTRAKRIEPMPDWSATLIFTDKNDSDMHDASIVDISSTGCRLNEVEYTPSTGQLVYLIFMGGDDGIYTLRASVVKVFGPTEMAIHFETAADDVGDFKQSNIDEFVEYISRYAPGEEEWA